MTWIEFGCISLERVADNTEYREEGKRGGGERKNEEGQEMEWNGMEWNGMERNESQQMGTDAGADAGLALD